MKVIQFIPSLGMGGAETLVKDYCLLKNPKIEMVVVILGFFSNSQNEKILKKNNIKIISFLESIGVSKKNNLINKIYRRVRIELSFSCWLKHIIDEEKPDVIHCHLSVLHYFEPILSQLKGIKIVYTCHALVKLFFDGRNKKEDYIARKILNSVGLQFIALHSDMARELNSRFGINNTIVVNNGVDFRRFKHCKSNKQDKRKELKIPEDAFVVGHIGRLAVEKNHSFLIDIFYEISQKKENAFLLLVGSGPLKSTIEQKLSSLHLNDKYLILENRSDIPELMRVMDVFVFPSLFEGLPVSLIEAQVSGLRCIISDTIDNKILLTDHILPISLNKSPAHWSDIILKANLKNKNVLGNLDDYDMNRVMKKLEAIYES